MEIQVGINYACITFAPENGNETVCEMLPFLYTSGFGGPPSATIFVVRSFITLNVVFMIIGVALSLWSIGCHGTRKTKVVTAVVNILSSLFGVSGLAMFAAASTTYTSPFDSLQTPEDPAQIKCATLQLSFFLSCGGCTLFTVVICVEILLNLRGRERLDSDSSTTKLYRRDEINSTFDSQRHTMSPISTQNTIHSEWTYVETCHVEIFSNMFRK